MRFAFGELIDDIGPWLLLGFFIAGVITYWVPDDLIQSYLGSGWISLVVMLLIGIPVFVCATSSTPIVAALALKGLSPGAALVFLLAGPVTNAATITVLLTLLGRRITMVYVAVIATISVLLGLAVNWLYVRFSISVTDWVQGDMSESHGLMTYGLSLFLVVLILARLWIQWRARSARMKLERKNPNRCPSSPSC